MSRSQEYNGITFWETKRGYYLGKSPDSDKPIWMHRYVWETERGAIPKGYQVHHIDGDRANNDISNLHLLESRVHLTQHMADEKRKQQSLDAMNNHARPAAIRWHKSSAGSDWHKLHFDQSLRGKFGEMIELQCQYCGKNFKTSVLMRNKAKFCSNNCKSASRRESGVDDISVRCEACGKEFLTNRHLPRRFCSEQCQNNTIVGKRKAVLRYSHDGELIGTYRSAAEAARETGISASNISRYCSGKVKCPSGDIWRYQSNSNDII